MGLASVGGAGHNIVGEGLNSMAGGYSFLEQGAEAKILLNH